MAKEQRRGNREIKKPKQEKTAPQPAGLFGSQDGGAANINTKRAKGKMRW